jgi:hypothetical protein
MTWVWRSLYLLSWGLSFACGPVAAQASPCARSRTRSEFHDCFERGLHAAERTVRLQVEPGLIQLVVGERYSLDSLHVAAFDSSGYRLPWVPAGVEILGESLRRLDSATVVADRVGTAILSVWLPLPDASGRLFREFARVPVRITQPR